jgi:hypothetical protein
MPGAVRKRETAPGPAAGRHARLARVTAAPTTTTRRKRSARTRPPANSTPAAPSPRHPALLLALAAAAASIVVSVSFTLYDADAWQNLAFGRPIWTHGAVPTTQIFAWPHYGEPLVNPSWGFTALNWPIWSAAGVPGLFVWRWATTLAVFALLWLAARRMGARGFSALV